LWMAIALATWWLLSEGGDAEAQDDQLLDIPLIAFPGAARRRGKRWRLVGIFHRSWSLIVAALLNHQLLPIRPGRPEAWPVLPQIVDTDWAVSTVGTGG
ncbi:MAG: hypothetical protein ACXWJB_12585, partial [Limisphaerales bacterium]